MLKNAGFRVYLEKQIFSGIRSIIREKGSGMDEKLYRRKVLGCWLGKAVGGTLGAPFEGWDGPHHLEFYDPVPTTMVPNDDLDLQVVWFCTMRKLAKPVVDSQILAGAWLDNVGFPCDEYGVAIRNLRNGIRPPFSGSYDNWFVDGMGAAIRSEIWACLAPGDPELAAKFAYEDACVDHAGNGMWGEVFLAAMESAAFGESDVRRIVEIGKSCIPADCELRTGIEDAIRWFDEKPQFDYLFGKIMKKYKSDNFTDVKVNFPIIVAGLLLGNGDFSKSICEAVNFGEDTDCTGATVGSIMGILNPDGIPEKWLKPIGRTMVLSPGITGITPPATIDEFSDEICEMRKVITLDPHPAKAFKPTPVKALAVVRPYRSKAEPTEPVTFSGNCCVWPKPLPDNHHELLLKFRFRVPADGEYCVMFNSRAQTVVQVDGELAFRREPGSIVPSFHRAPWNQSRRMFLKQGVHELEALVQRVPDGQLPTWVIGVGYGDTLQWVPDAFLVD